VRVQSPYSPKPMPSPLGLSLGASLPGVLAWLLTSSLSPQRWSQTSCAVSGRCCESWTVTTPPASATEVRQNPGTAPGDQLPTSPIPPRWGVIWPQTPTAPVSPMAQRWRGRGWPRLPGAALHFVTCSRSC